MMGSVLVKYHDHSGEYLIYDTTRGGQELDERSVRAICARNFGVGLEGILCGAFGNNGKTNLRLYRPDGRIDRTASAREEVKALCSRYCEDAGYPVSTRSCAEKTSVCMTGRIYLMDEFFTRNGLAAL